MKLNSFASLDDTLLLQIALADCSIIKTLMKYLLPLITVAIGFTPVHALEFHVCTDTNGVRHISNQAEFFNPDCSIREDIYLQVLRKQHADLQSRHLQAMEINVTDDPGPGITDKITGRINELLNHDKALDELQSRQQQRRDDVPFRTHLQTESFQRLLELQ